MTKHLFLSVLSALVTAVVVSSARAQDEDAQGRRWFLDVSYRKLAPITIHEGAGRGRTRTFWYVLLKVTNNTGQDRPLDLTARALTPQVKKKPVAAAGYYPEVTAAIAKKRGIKKLANIVALSGTLADGASRDIVIVFPSLSKLANLIDVRVGGLTNTLYQEGRTVWREDTELSIRFHRIGDEFDVTRNRVADKGKSWVTVKRTKIRG